MKKTIDLNTAELIDIMTKSSKLDDLTVCDLVTMFANPDHDGIYIECDGKTVTLKIAADVWNEKWRTAKDNAITFPREIREEIYALKEAFPKSYVNDHGEMIVEPHANQYFIIEGCETKEDIKAKVLEWLSRGACKTEPYETPKRNAEFRQYMKDGVNAYLGTDFTQNELMAIYTYLGNCVNHQRTLNFIRSGYNFSVLEEKAVATGFYKSESYTDLRTLPDGQRFHVENGDWTGYVFSKDGEKYVHVDATCREWKLNGNEELNITLIKNREWQNPEFCDIEDPVELEDEYDEDEELE